MGIISTPPVRTGLTDLHNTGEGGIAPLTPRFRHHCNLNMYWNVQKITNLPWIGLEFTTSEVKQTMSNKNTIKLMVFMFLKFCSTDRFPLLFLILHLQKKHSCYLLIILNAFQNDAHTGITRLAWAWRGMALRHMPVAQKQNATHD